MIKDIDPGTCSTWWNHVHCQLPLIRLSA